nr:RNA-directed DNA polymerase, eukaryota [Tanacetum cinerariifolium]
MPSRIGEQNCVPGVVILHPGFKRTLYTLVRTPIWDLQTDIRGRRLPKSHLLGVGILDNCVAEAAKSIGCSIMKAPFKYLGILVGDNMSSIKAWDGTISKMKKRLSRWKLNTLSVG